MAYLIMTLQFEWRYSDNWLSWVHH